MFEFVDVKKKGDGVLDSLDLGLFFSFSFSYWGFVVGGGGGECVVVLGMLEFDVVVVIFVVLSLVFFFLVFGCVLRFCFLFFGEGVEFDFLLLKEVRYIFLVKYDFERYFIDDV